MGKGGNRSGNLRSKVEGVRGSDKNHQDATISASKNTQVIPPAHVLPADCRWDIRLTIRLREAIGWILTANFILFWAIPIAGQGLLWKHVMQYVMRPFFYCLDSSYSPIRWIGANYVYNNPRHADYAATAFLVALSGVVSLYLVFSYQLSHGSLSWTAITLYYWAWVGMGGRQMGGAYTFAHKEGHNRFMYQPWFRNSIGNFFENVMGVFYGNVPWNFTTSHISIHHKLQGGMGDTFYQWDIDRTSWRDFMLFIYRISTHMTGFSSLYFFRKNDQKKAYEMLTRGMLYYWIVWPTIIYAITGSLTFIFFIYLQPCIAMTYFLAFINIGLHGYIEFDGQGKHVQVINSTAVVDGEDDYFGEDDHLAHHYATNVYFKDLPDYRNKRMEDFKKHHASVFQKFSILEHSLFLLLKDWDKLAEHYVDYTGQMSKDEIKSMLKKRAERKEIGYLEYEFEWLPALQKNHWMK